LRFLQKILSVFPTYHKTDPILNVGARSDRIRELRIMIELYFWTTPNGYKPLLLLEETGLPYRIVPVDISRGAQFEPAFLAISPNNRIPAIVDHTPGESALPISIFESGAILLYLAEKSGRFLPYDTAGRAETLQWLFWQMGGLGPMLGQNLHFSAFAPERLPYAIDRYMRETDRLYGVLDRRLASRPYLAGAYSIADMASYPWIVTLERRQPRLDRFPNIRRWYDAIGDRPATARTYEIGRRINLTPTVTEESKTLLFGQGATPRAA
jgi:GST-like protein